MDNKFYSTIRKYYDYIFTLNQAQVDFIKSEFADEKSKLIEVGCANGKLTDALKKYDICGIDLEESFIDIAKEHYPKVKFSVLNMLSIDTLNDTFDGIICFGNTLVHLKHEEIEEFIKKCYGKLNAGGKLLLQILNYDNILDNSIKCLPLIDNEQVMFVREYEFGERIKFNTKLTVKKDNEIISNSIFLTPVRKDVLLNMLKDNGFETIKTYGSFKKTALKNDSLPLIVSCVKE